MSEAIDDHDDQEILKSLNDRMFLQEHMVDGKVRAAAHKGYGDMYLFHIEQFVKKIESGQGEFTLNKSYYRDINDWLGRYSDLYHYSPRVEVFYEACKDIRLMQNDSETVASTDSKWSMNLLRTLTDDIRARCQSHEFRGKERFRKINAQRREQQALAAEEALFTLKSRWLVLSLTLGFKKEFRDGITLQMLQRYRNRLFASRRYNTLMSGIEWFAWKIEQGQDTGLHLHVILFYSTEHNHDEYLAKRIGEYWSDQITDGKGDYWNSNQAWLKPRYANYGHGIGVGQINWNDAQKRESLRKNLVYLTKAEQYLMIKDTKGIRTFDMARVPKRIKAGRPRIVGQSLTIE
jgi:hypothetical protein